ncbi:hypothetical protein QBC37DRAFT_294681, partial [Rhypophila decipiens]
LEIGCGQGDFTVPLAHPDTSSPSIPRDYGTSPLGDAQDHIKVSPAGPPSTFTRIGPSNTPRMPIHFDHIILTQSVWYLLDPTALSDIFQAAVGRTRSILIAEFAMSTSRPEGMPHVLTALAINALESFGDHSSCRNLRCGLTPKQIVQSAEKAGWTLRAGTETKMTTPGENRDRWCETYMLLKRPQFEEYGEGVLTEKTKCVLFGMRDAAQACVDRLGGGRDSEFGS